MRSRKRRGPHWIVHSHLFEADEYECSECGCTVRKVGRVCPKCGAVIRQQKDDQEWVDEAEFIEWMVEEEM